jgi:hypothetical protein
MKILTTCIFALFALTNISAQIEHSDKQSQTLLYPKALLNHYSKAEIEEIKNLDSLKLQSLVYYYTSSFIFEKISCEECLPFESENFDVSEYENRRKEEVNFTFSNYKFGFKVTLISKKDMTFKYPLSGNTNQNLEDYE